MKLWKRASGALKDKNSLFVASLSRRTSYRNPDLEAAVIKATSHDESRVDYKNAQRVFMWIRSSPAYLKPLVWALSTRLEKTHSWAVALKGLMLMHGVFFLKSPAARMVGRLPFDLSNFDDGGRYPNLGNAWGYNAFIRAYFAFLDKKSTIFSLDLKEETNNKNKKQVIEETTVQQLIKLQHSQILLDMLMQIRPRTEQMRGKLILEAMDCVIIEVFDVYSRICNGIARVLIRIYGASGKTEATMALKVLQKATLQAEQLCLYFKLCRDIGVLNPKEFPKVEKIPEEDIIELEKIINEVLDNNDTPKAEENKAMVVHEENRLKTVVTDKWEIFDDQEDLNKGFNANIPLLMDVETNCTSVNEDLLGTCLMIQQPHHVNSYKQEIPDLISF